MPRCFCWSFGFPHYHQLCEYYLCFRWSVKPTQLGTSPFSECTEFPLPPHSDRKCVSPMEGSTCLMTMMMNLGRATQGNDPCISWTRYITWIFLTYFLNSVNRRLDNVCPCWKSSKVIRKMKKWISNFQWSLTSYSSIVVVWFSLKKNWNI